MKEQNINIKQDQIDPKQCEGQVDALVIPPDELKDYIYSEQGSLWGARQAIGFGSKLFYIKEIDRELSNKVIIENHYSHKVCNAATTHIHLGCYKDDRLIGVLQFGYAMNPQSMDKIVKDTALDQYKELNRMWFEDSAEKNTESKAISYSIKYIKKRFPKVKWIQSFADERCGMFGIVYQAANFDYYGSHESVFWEFENEVYHNSIITNNGRSRKKWLEDRDFHKKAVSFTLRQFRYIYFIDKKWRRKCLLALRPYPKYYNEPRAV